jgi:hypothetical protein
MLVSDRTAMAQKPISTLVTLDKVFELVEGNLSNERRTDIYEISEQCKGDPQDHGWMLRVAKVICLLEFIRDLPRTEANIAAFLVDAVGKPAPVGEVEEAVKKLYSAQFIRNTEDGWKLQTAQEKSWETERRGHLEPKPRDRNEIIRQMLRIIFGEAALRTYRYRDFRSFRVGLRVDGAEIGDEGDLPLSLCVADDPEEMSKRLAEVREEGRQPPHKNDVYWLFALTPEIDDMVGQLYASRKMVEKYDQLRAQNKITTEEATCLQDEKNAVITYQSRLQDKLTQVMEKGTGLFQGVAWEAASLGKNLSEILKTLFGHVVPDLYPKLEMGARPLKGDEAESVLKAADLKALPQVFYAGDNGLGLIVQDGPKLVLNTAADVAKEVFDYLVSEHSYGNKDTRTGRALERKFSGIGYGWDRDMLRLVLAVLFRAGSIEVTYQGNRFRNYQDPLTRVPFTNTVAFRTSLFSPRDTLNLKTLTLAVQQLEELTGEEIDVEEGAIASAFKTLASEELEKLYPLKATAEAYQLPVLSLITDFQQTLMGIQASSSDDCVRLLTETGDVFRESRERLRKMRTVLDGNALTHIREARTAIHDVGPRLTSHPLFAEVEGHLKELQTLLQSEQLLEELDNLDTHARAVMSVYQVAYCDLFDRRREAYLKALDELKGRAEWQAVFPTSPDELPPPLKELLDALIAPLQVRLGDEADRQGVATGTSLGKSTLAEMTSDLAVVEALKASALTQLREMMAEKESDVVIRRVRMADILNRPIRSQEDLKAALAQLEDVIQKLLDEGAAVILE